MRVEATFTVAYEVTRTVEVDEAAFEEWAEGRYGSGWDHDLAVAAYIDRMSPDALAESVFPDWRATEPLPADFELAYVDCGDTVRLDVAG